MGIDEPEFERAKQKVIGAGRERRGIGTLGEKTVHAVLKHYYAPDENLHEVPVGQFVADICTGTEIIEIQTRSFQNMRKKLEAFLPLGPVTIVYPIPHVKWLSWIDEETGEASPRRKSPKRGNVYQAFIELYKIRSFLPNANLRFCFDLIDMHEFRLLNGWSHDRKRGSDRYDRIPERFVEEIRISRRADYRQFLPDGIAEPFTTRDFAAQAKIPVRLAQTVLLILTDLAVVRRTGKEGRRYLYEAEHMPFDA